jgi:hypothetical protein
MKKVQYILAGVSGKRVKKSKRKQMPALKKGIISGLRTGAVLAILLPAAAQAQVPDTLVAARNASGVTRMSLHTNGSLYVGGTFDGGAAGTGIPAEGAGTRLMWYPEKASFRAGYIDGTQWDDANIGVSSFAAGYNVRALGDYSVALGNSSQATGTSTFAVGENNTATGAASVAMGYRAHTNARQGSFVFADRSTIDTLRAGVNHSANWRVSSGFRIFTSSNLSTGLTIQSGATVSNWGQSNAVISTSTGAYLSTSGVWTNVSDVNRKHHFEAVSGEDILGRLRQIPIQRWSYRTDNDSVHHIGPTAQDFRAAFGLGNDERTIGTVDADGVALAGVQALEARSRHQAAALEILKAENAELRKRLDAMEKGTGIKIAGLPLLVILLLAGTGFAGLLLRRRAAAKAS